MFPVNGFLYFLLIIDVFSRHIYVEALKKKDAPSVAKAMEKIFSIIEEKNTRIQYFQTVQVIYLYENLDCVLKEKYVSDLKKILAFHKYLFA